MCMDFEVYLNLYECRRYSIHGVGVMVIEEYLNLGVD